MPKLTKPETAERNLRMAYDTEYYASRRALIRTVLGERFVAPSSGLSSSLTGEIPDDPDILPRFYEPGISKRILTNQLLMVAKICYMEPDPDYPDKEHWKEKVTKAFNRALWKGRPHLGPTKFEEYGEWAPECHRAFMDGDGLGVGFLQIGVRDGWVCIQHHPLTRVIWDRHRLGVSRARYIAFVHNLSEEEAVAMFGTAIRKEIEDSASQPNSLRTLKAVQYFDMGLGENDPTEMWRLKTLGGRVLDVSENKYGCLPFAHYEHTHTFGMRRPEGRVSAQIPDQVMRNAYERYERLVLERGPGVDFVNTTGLNPQDADAWAEGELLPMVRMELGLAGKVSDNVLRVQAHEVPTTLYQGREYLDRMDPGNSGISDADRANVTSSPRTLGEVEEVQEGADTQKNLSQRKYADMLQRLFYKSNYIAAKLHTAPTPVSIDGIPFLLNDPEVPQSNVAYWLTPNSWPSVNEDLLARQNPLRKMQIAQGKWLALTADPIIGPTLNPVEVAKTLIRDGYGEKDPERFLLTPEQMAMQQMMAMQPEPGMEGQPMGPSAGPQMPV